MITPSRTGRPCLLLLTTLALGLLLPLSSEAQVLPDTIVEVEEPPRSVVAIPAQDSTTLPRLPSPGGAFLRSVLVPGWGQAAYGAYFRGGIYFAAEAGSWFMLLKSAARLGEAKEIERWRVAAVRDSLFTTIEADEELWEEFNNWPGGLEDAIRREVDDHPAVEEIRGLVDSRKEQREDWLVLTLFWMLASGLDAFVTAHLSDFPAAVNAEARPAGRYDFGISIPVGGRR